MGPCISERMSFFWPNIFLLTYSHPKHEASYGALDTCMFDRDQFCDTWLRVRAPGMYIIALERSQMYPDGRHHVHVLVSLATPIGRGSATLFDTAGIHPNVLPVAEPGEPGRLLERGERKWGDAPTKGSGSSQFWTGKKSDYGGHVRRRQSGQRKIHGDIPSWSGRVPPSYNAAIEYVKKGGCWYFYGSRVANDGLPDSGCACPAGFLQRGKISWYGGDTTSPTVAPSTCSCKSRQEKMETKIEACVERSRGWDHGSVRGRFPFGGQRVDARESSRKDFRYPTYASNRELANELRAEFDV